MNNEISIIMPAYNEEDNVEQAIGECLKALPNFFERFEIVAVDDGSTDKTGDILDKIARNTQNIKVVHQNPNRGIGAAVREGIKNSKYKYVFLTPADLQFDISEIELFIPHMRDADIVIGYPKDVNYNFYRKFISWFNLFLLRVLFGLKVQNANWVKLFDKKIFETISIIYDGFFWDSQVLIDANRKGFRIKEVGVSKHDRKAGEAKGASPIRAFKTFLEMIKYWIK